MREALEQDPGAPRATRWLGSLARASQPDDGCALSLLETGSPLHGAGLPVPHFYGSPRTIPTIPYNQALSRLAGRDGSLDVRGKAVFVGLSSHTGAEHEGSTRSSRAERPRSERRRVRETAFANIWEGHQAGLRRDRARPRHRLGARPRVPRVAPALLAAPRPHSCPWPACCILSRGTGSPPRGCGCHWSGRWPSRSGSPAASALWRHRRSTSPAALHYLPPKWRRSWPARSATWPRPAGLRHVHVHGCSSVHESLGDHGARGARRPHEPLLCGPAREPVKRHGGLVQDVVGELDARDLGQPSRTSPCGTVRAWRPWTSPPGTLQRRAGPPGPSDPHRAALGHPPLGSVGAMDHYEYRAVGDVVNTATPRGSTSTWGPAPRERGRAPRNGLMSRELGRSSSWASRRRSRAGLTGSRRHACGPRGAMLYLSGLSTPTGVGLCLRPCGSGEKRSARTEPIGQPLLLQWCATRH